MGAMVAIGRLVNTSIPQERLEMASKAEAAQAMVAEVTASVKEVTFATGLIACFRIHQANLVLASKQPRYAHRWCCAASFQTGKAACEGRRPKSAETRR